MATNDNWETAPNLAELRAASITVGAFDLIPGSADAAVLVTLKPGNYTVLTNGAGLSTGVAMIEIYEVP